jgi:hypothetical protein
MDIRDVGLMAALGVRALATPLAVLYEARCGRQFGTDFPEVRSYMAALDDTLPAFCQHLML